MDSTDLELGALFTTDGKDLWELDSYYTEPSCRLRKISPRLVSMGAEWETTDFAIQSRSSQSFRRVYMKDAAAEPEAVVNLKEGESINPDCLNCRGTGCWGSVRWGGIPCPDCRPVAYAEWHKGDKEEINANCGNCGGAGRITYPTGQRPCCMCRPTAYMEWFNKLNREE